MRKIKEAHFLEALICRSAYLLLVVTFISSGLLSAPVALAGPQIQLPPGSFKPALPRGTDTAPLHLRCADPAIERVWLENVHRGRSLGAGPIFNFDIKVQVKNIGNKTFASSHYVVVTLRADRRLLEFWAVRTPWRSREQHVFSWHVRHELGGEFARNFTFKIRYADSSPGDIRDCRPRNNSRTMASAQVAARLAHAR